MCELIGTSCRLSEQHIDLLFDPLLVVWRICVGRFLVDQAADVLHLDGGIIRMCISICALKFVNLSIHLLSYLIDEIEQLTDVVGDRRRVRIQALQMLLVDLADAFHALVDTFVVTVGPGFRTRIGLDEQDCVRHAADERRGRENTQ